LPCLEQTAILSEFSTVHAVPNIFFKIHYYKSLSKPGFSNVFFALDSSMCPLHEFLVFPLTCQLPLPFHRPRIHYVILFSEEYKPWSSSLCNFLYPCLSLIGPNIFLIPPFSNIYSLCTSLIRQTTFHALVFVFDKRVDLISSVLCIAFKATFFIVFMKLWLFRLGSGNFLNGISLFSWLDLFILLC